MGGFPPIVHAEVVGWVGRVEKYDDIPVFQGHERERGPTKMISRKALK